MKNHIEWLEIKNFKSIRDLRMECARINVIVGKPNVGKSNILEALSLLGGNFFFDFDEKSGTLQNGLRFRETLDLFYQWNAQSNIEISSNIVEATLLQEKGTPDFLYAWKKGNQTMKKWKWTQFEPSKKIMLDNFEESKYHNSNNSENIEYNWQDQMPIPPGLLKLNLTGKIIDQLGWESKFLSNPIKAFHFREHKPEKKSFQQFLLPPYGANLYSVVRTNEEVQNFLRTALSPFDLKITFDSEQKKIRVGKHRGEELIITDFQIVADTIRRMTFYISAVYSNENSVLVFEEPETNSYPPFVSHLAQEIIDSATNQFFITTHNPYLFGSLIEDTEEGGLAVFIAYYENHETKLVKLSEEELREVLDYGIDIFYNLDSFIHAKAE